MAKKRKRKSTPKTKKSKKKNSTRSQAKKRCGPLLQQAVQHLRVKRIDRALKVAREGLRWASTEEEKQQANQVMAEANFRLAMLADVSKQRSKLKQALSFTPDDARIRFYHGIALWREERLSEAIKELKFVARREPNRPALQFLLQLANLANEKPWTPSKLSVSETQTLQTIDKILNQRRTSASKLSLPSTNADIWKPLLQMYTGHESPLDTLQQVAEKSQNTHIKSILHYYEGVAAIRKGQGYHAKVAWNEAQKTGVSAPWLKENLAYRLREQAAELSKEEKWSDIITLTSLTPEQLDDRILAETIGLAYFHLGYEQAQSKNWSRAAHYWRKSEQWSRNRYIAQNLALAEEALENWSQAANAWRDMVRRRPRSKKNKDYLTDSQVSSIWEHLAECYSNTEDFGEVVNSLKNAVKYDEQNLELRMDLARSHYANDSEASARNQFEAILEIDPNYIDALIPLAHIELERGWSESIPLWKRVLAIQPNHSDAREGLAQAYLKKLRQTMWLGKSSLAKIAKEAQADLPNHPLLLFAIGEKYQYLRDYKQSLDYYLRAYEAGPDNIRVIDMILESLLEIGAERELEALIPKVAAIPSLLPGFWFDLARKALRDEEEPKWIKIYLEEAIALASRDYVQDTLNTLFMKAYELIERVAPDSLCDYFAERIRKEVPTDGAVEFVKACEALDDGDERNAKRWFNKAKKAARRAKDNKAVKFIEETETTNFSMPDFDLRSGFLAHLLDMLPDGVSLEDLLD